MSDQYSRILKSSSLIGGAQGINMLIGMVRVKFVAILIGPVGIGLQGMYQTIQGFAGTLAGLGIGASGVREVADAFGSGDQDRVARTVLTLRRMCWITGLGGGILLAALSLPLSNLAFQSPDYAFEISLLGISLLLGNLAAGQSALIQGARRISDLARMRILGSIIGSVVSVGLYAWLGIDGIIPALLILALVTLVIANRFAARIPLQKVSMPWKESFRAAGGLVRLGIALMWTGLLGAAVGLATRAMITHQLDLVAVGIFVAAFRLSGQFVDFILGAMGADYYPSLTALNHDHERMRQLVNQQTEVGLLLGLPGLIATLAFAPMAIAIFYSSEFTPAAELLRWFVLGCMGRVISWPLGFVMLAKGKGSLFAGTQTAFNLIHLELIAIGLIVFGLKGVALAFFILYIITTIVVYLISYRLIDFHWTSKVLRLLGVLIVSAVSGFLTTEFLQPQHAAIAGGGLVVLTGLFSVRELSTRLGPQHRLVRMANRLPFAKWLVPSAS